jgi:predicted nucleic acid-binding protein
LRPSAPAQSLLTINSRVADTYAHLRAQLEQAGTPTGPNDTWIAAEALHHKLVLVTDNTREFSRVPGLQVENWLEALPHADRLLLHPARRQAARLGQGIPDLCWKP